MLKVISSLLSENSVVLLSVSSAVTTIVVAWLRGKSRRKVRLKVDKNGYLIEAGSSKEVQRLLQDARQSHQDVRARATPKS